MTESISQLTLLHQELRQGSTCQVPRHLTHALTPALHQAMELSHQHRQTVALEGTSFELFSDMTYCAEGNSCYYLAANSAMGGGKIEAGTVLYIGVCAARLGTSPSAWRHLLRDYLAAASSARMGVKFGSFVGMPNHLPWAAGFWTAEANSLTRSERDFLTILVRLIAVRLAEVGEKESRAAEKKGQRFDPDPEEYPELLG